MASYENSYQSKGPSTGVSPRLGSAAAVRSRTSQLLNNRPQSVQLQQLQSAVDASPRAQQLNSLGSILNGGIRPVQLVRGTVTRPLALNAGAPVQLLQGTVRRGPKNIHHQPFMIHSDDGRFFGVPFGVEVGDGDVVDFDIDPKAFYLATNVVRRDREESDSDDGELNEDENEFDNKNLSDDELAELSVDENDFDLMRKELKKAKKENPFSSAIKFLNKNVTDPTDIMGNMPGYDWLALHRRLLASGDLRKTPRKGKSAKITRNRVKASMTFCIVDSKDNVRTITRVIGDDFVSGESATQSQVESWLKQIKRGPYDAGRHAHSEQDLGVYLRTRKNLEALANTLAEGLEDGERVNGFMLDLVSYPNTVCNECYPSIDETLAQHVVPFFEKFFNVKDLNWMVNASAVNLFPGVGSRAKSKGTWMEALVDYDKVGKQEETSRQSNERSNRGNKKRGSISLDQPKAKYPGQEAVRAAANRFATVHVANGDGLACYIRSIMLGLAAGGIIANNQVENLVDTVTDHLADVNLRMDETMIDAGGLAAAEVRRAIAQLTGGIVDGGIDIGISVVLWDPDSNSFQHFVANNGTYQMTLLYTPGHFDFLEM